MTTVKSLAAKVEQLLPKVFFSFFVDRGNNHALGVISPEEEINSKYKNEWME